MVSNGPFAAEGWLDFLEDEDDVWYDAFKTRTVDGETCLDVDAYDEFDSLQDLVNFVAGTGVYEDRNSFIPSEKDKNARKRQLHNDQWKVPDKLDELAGYLREDGVKYTDIDIDPNAYAGWSVSEQAAHRDDRDVKYTAHFMAYDPDEKSDDPNAHVYMAFSWYDDEPSSFNLEDIVDFDDVDGMLEE